MILADTSVWVDHLREEDEELVVLLRSRKVLTHPHVIGEVALGGLRLQSPNMRLLMNLRHAVVASSEAVFELITREGVVGTGIGYVDCHLLAATRLTPNAKLWTRDQRLQAVAVRLGVAYDRSPN